MKKGYILICTLCISMATANAQKIGIKAGLSMTNAKYEYTSPININTSNLFGIQLGLTSDVPISNEFSFNSGVLFSQKGTKLNVRNIEVKFPISYLEIPLNMVYKCNVGNANLFAEAGPYLGVGLSAKMKGLVEKSKIEFGSDNDQIKRIDIGINFGAGLEIDAIQWGINYGLGLTNLSHDGRELFKNGVLTLSVAILFGPI